MSCARHSANANRVTVPGRLLRTIVLGWLLLASLAFPIAGTLAQTSGGQVGVIRVEGAITPVMATYIGRGIERAADRGDAAVVLSMDTPGGLSSAMDDIINDILASSIPVMVYVAPDGARAGSAGVYIAYAAHIAAMAPVSNIGSATPVQMGGEESDTETAMDRKVTNDAVAKIRSLAELRGRNADWGEDAVRQAENITSSQALRMNVIDIVANSVDDLLQQADGRVVKINGQDVTVHTAGAQTRDIQMNLLERLLQVVTDPNIAFLLVSMGSLAIVFELANPGGIGPGAIGAIMLLTGFYALGTINANFAGLALMGLAFVLFMLDVYFPTHGVLTASGIASFLIGGLLLSNTRDPEVSQVSKVVIFTVTILMAMFFIFIVGSIWRTRNRPVATGESSLLGATAVARGDLTPDGMVFVQGELWQATSASGTVTSGSKVRIDSIDGLHMNVSPIGDDG